jgi:ubiquitin-conjugating enzyme E2 O
MAYEDAIGQIICRGDTVTVLNLAAAAAADGNHCGVVLWKGRPGPNKVLVRRLHGSKMIVNASDVRVVDRSFMQPSMVLASPTDIGGQLGMVMCAATELDLARLPSPDGNGNDENSAPAVIARAVSPAEVRVRRAGGEFCVGDYVVLGKKYRPVESEISEISRLPTGSEFFHLSSEIFIFLKFCHPNRC